MFDLDRVGHCSIICVCHFCCLICVLFKDYLYVLLSSYACLIIVLFYRPGINDAAAQYGLISIRRCFRYWSYSSRGLILALKNKTRNKTIWLHAFFVVLLVVLFLFRSYSSNKTNIRPNLQSHPDYKTTFAVT